MSTSTKTVSPAPHMYPDSLCVSAEGVAHALGGDIVELSCSFEGTWILSCSSESLEVVLIQKLFDSTFSVVAFRVLFWPVPQWLQMWFFFSLSLELFSFPIIIFWETFFFWVHVHSIEHRHDIQSSFWTSLQTCLFSKLCFFPGKLWCGLQLWTSNIEAIFLMCNTFSHGGPSAGVCGSLVE